MPLSSTCSRRLAATVALGRVGLGVVALSLPRLPLRPWVGSRADDPGALVLARALGARDLALGCGALLALNSGSQARTWVQAGAVADACDALITLAARRDLPRLGPWAVVIAAGGAAVAGALSARALDTT